VETSGWYPRLAYMFWFQDLIVFHNVNKQKKPAEIVKNTVLENLSFLVVPSPIDLKHSRDIRTSTRNSVYVSLVYSIVCLHFVNINKGNTLYGLFAHLWVKSFET
jgi:hypothetical protein